MNIHSVVSIRSMKLLHSVRRVSKVNALPVPIHTGFFEAVSSLFVFSFGVLLGGFRT